MGIVHTVGIINESETVFQTVFVDFLTVHAKLRNKRLAPVLIQELTRQATNDGILLAYYSTVVEPSVPVATTKFFLYPLKLEKLIDAEYWRRPPPGVKLSSLVRTFSEIPPSSVEWTATEDAKLLAKKLTAWAKSGGHQIFRLISEDDVRRWQEAGFKLYESPIGYIGYYILDNHSLLHSTLALKEVFILYVVGDSINELLKGLLGLARDDDADVIIATEQSLLSSKDLIEAKFKPSAEATNWFLYNYHHCPLTPRELFLPVP